MKKINRIKIFSMLFTLILICIALSNCGKDKLQASNLKLLQHRWIAVSSSTRQTVIGSFVGPWNTTPFSTGIYQEWTKDGTSTSVTFGSAYSHPYKLIHDSVIINLHPATSTSSYGAPDTTFIRNINDSILVIYSRSYFLSATYNSLDEKILSFIR